MEEQMPPENKTNKDEDLGLLSKFIKRKTEGKERTVAMIMLVAVFLIFFYILFNRHEVKQENREFDTSKFLDDASENLQIDETIKKANDILEMKNLMQLYETELNKENKDTVMIKKLEIQIQKIVDDEKQN